jgi:hypothetical protein
MRRPTLLLFLLLVVTSLSCNLFTRSVSPVEKISAPTFAPTMTASITSTPIPTSTRIPSATPSQTSTRPEEKSTPSFTPAPTIVSGYEDDFNQASSDWNDFLTVTTQSNPMKSNVYLENGFLFFDLIDKETYLYQFHKYALSPDVEIEATFTNQGDLNNGIALVCRAAEDYNSWYEARVSSSGNYKFFRYDKGKKTQGNGNPYIELSAGPVNFNFLYPDKSNVIRFSCKGSTLTLDINNGKKVFSVTDEALTAGGLAGIGVLSYEVPSVKVAFDSFKANSLP